MNTKNQNSKFYTIILIILATVLTLFYGSFFLKTPLTSASDVMHHTWIANQISETGTIPSTNPITGNFDILSLSPLFQILGSQLNQITGIEVIYIYIALNILLIPFYIFTIFLLTKEIFNSAGVGIFSSLLFFVFNSTTYLSRHITFIEIKQATFAILLFLIFLYILVKLIRINELKYPLIIILLFLLTSILLTHQFTSFALFSIIASLIVLILIFYKKSRRIAYSLLTISVLSIIFVIALNFNLLFSQNSGYLTSSERTFTKDYTSSNDIVAAEIEGSYLVSTFRNAFHPITYTLALIGLLLLFIKILKQKSDINIPIILLFIWTITFLFLSLQPIGNYRLLPSRFLYWSTIPIAIFAGFGLNTILKLLSNNPITKLSMMAFVAITSFIIINTNSQSYYTNENISINELKSFLEIKNNFSDKQSVKFISDPFLGYKLITLSDINLVYNYQRTGMKRDDSLEMPVIINFILADSDTAYEYALENEADYIAINYDDKTRYYKDADYSKFDDSTKYKKVYNSYAGTEDELVIYEVVR